MLNELLEKLNEISQMVEKDFAEAKNPADIEAAKVKFTGRNGSITALAPMMGKIAKEDKPAAGKAFNEVKALVAKCMEEAKDRLGEGAAGAESIDVTLPGRKWTMGTQHPVSRTIDECCAIFRRMGFTVAAGPEIVYR